MSKPFEGSRPRPGLRTNSGGTSLRSARNSFRQQNRSCHCSWKPGTSTGNCMLTLKSKKALDSNSSLRAKRPPTLSPAHGIFKTPSRCSRKPNSSRDCKHPPLPHRRRRRPRPRALRPRRSELRAVCHRGNVSLSLTDWRSGTGRIKEIAPMGAAKSCTPTTRSRNPRRKSMRQADDSTTVVTPRRTRRNRQQDKPQSASREMSS